MYSATVWSNPQLYASHFGAAICYEAFQQCFERRAAGERIVVPAEVDQAFLETADPKLEAIRDLVIAHRLAQVRAADQELASQGARLADAMHRLQTQPTKGAGHSSRMAAQKVAAARQRRESLVKGPEQYQTARMFPGSYVPVLMMEGGKAVVRPMRYQCRPSQVERRMESLLDSPHHARRDNLEGRWQQQFGHTHGIVAAESLFDAVSLHRHHQRPPAIGEHLTALELEFVASPPQTLYLPCVWSHWERNGQPDLWSFAVIIDRAPSEVQQAGQDWCPMPIKREHIEKWLVPDASELVASHALLADRPSLCFESFPSSAERERLARPAPVRIINLWKPPGEATGPGEI